LSFSAVLNAKEISSLKQISWFPSAPCPSENEAEELRQLAKKNYSTYYNKINRKDCYKPWTVLVYMAADNNLTPYAYWDLYEMESGWSKEDTDRFAQNWGTFSNSKDKKNNKFIAGSSSRLDVITQLDTEGNHGINRYHMFQSDQIYSNNKTLNYFKNDFPNQIYSPIIEQLPEEKEDHSQKKYNLRLLDFLERSIKQYPAQNYMLVIWGHGQGWAPVKGDNSSLSRGFGGVGFDESQNTYLAIPTIRGLLRSISHRVFEDKKVLDVYASDACLMQMLEVATEIAPVTRFISGSAQTQDYLGLPYRHLFYAINTQNFNGLKQWNHNEPVYLHDNILDEAYLVSKNLPKYALSSFDPQFGLQTQISPEAVKMMTMSSLSSASFLNELLPAVSHWGNALTKYLKEDYFRGIDIENEINQSPVFLGTGQDLGIFSTQILSLLKSESERQGVETQAAQNLKIQSNALKSAMQKTVISYEVGSYYKGVDHQLYLSGFKGLSVWLPKNKDEFTSKFEIYKKSTLYKTVLDWPKWIESLYSNQ